jgi:hypothetical protein
VQPSTADRSSRARIVLAWLLVECRGGEVVGFLGEPRAKDWADPFPERNLGDCTSDLPRNCMGPKEILYVVSFQKEIEQDIFEIILE